MKTPVFQIVAPLLCAVSLCLAMPSVARAGKMDGINYLIAVTQMKASNANDEALQGADKQRQLIEKKKALFNSGAQLEGAALAPPDRSVSQAGQIVDDIAAVVAFESTASAGGIDEAELKELGDLVGVARGRVDTAIADATTQVVDAKKLLAATTDADEKVRLKLQLRSLRATVKAHRRTAAALTSLAKRLVS